MKNPYETQEEVVADLEQQLQDAKGKLKTLEKYKHNYPIPYTLYVHGSEESNYEDGKKLGLDEEQLQTFWRTGYEIAFKGVIEEDGTFYATHINDVELPMRIEV